MRSGSHAASQHLQVGVRALAPNRIRVVNDERAPSEMRQGVANAAARFQDARALVRDDNLRRRAAAEVSLDLSGEVMDIHDGALDARLGEPVQRMIDEARARQAAGAVSERGRSADACASQIPPPAPSRC